MTAHRPSSSRPDLRERVAAQVLRLVNPLARWLIAAGLPTGAPNILLTVRGRRSGQPRTVPVGPLELDGRWFVQASYGAAGWAANLRAAGEATITDHGRRVAVQAVELPARGGGRPPAPRASAVPALAPATRAARTTVAASRRPAAAVPAPRR